MIKLFKSLSIPYIISLSVLFVVFIAISLFTEMPFFIYISLFIVLELIINFTFTMLAKKKHDKLFNIHLDDCDPDKLIKEYYPLLANAGDNLVDLVLLNLSAGYLYVGDFNSAQNALNNVRFHKLTNPYFKIIYYSNQVCLCSEMDKITEAQGFLEALKNTIDTMKKLKNMDKNKILLLYNSYVSAMNMKKDCYEGVEQQIFVLLQNSTNKAYMVVYKFNLAELYLKTGRVEEAKRLFEFVVQNGNTMYVVKEAEKYLAELIDIKL